MFNLSLGTRRSYIFLEVINKENYQVFYQMLEITQRFCNPPLLFAVFMTVMNLLVSTEDSLNLFHNKSLSFLHLDLAI